MSPPQWAVQHGSTLRPILSHCLIYDWIPTFVIRHKKWFPQQKSGLKGNNGLRSKREAKRQKKRECRGNIEQNISLTLSFNHSLPWPSPTYTPPPVRFLFLSLCHSIAVLPLRVEIDLLATGATFRAVWYTFWQWAGIMLMDWVTEDGAITQRIKVSITSNTAW